MLKRVLHSVNSRLRALPALNRAAYVELRRDRAGGHSLSEDPEDHLIAAVEWVTRGQDATPDDGVARAYSLAWDPYFRLKGWQPSYPETTGYIIPTLCDAAIHLQRPDLHQRALRMADWEINVQLPNGAVQGGMIGEQTKPTPAVFNTGQVIFGLLRAHRETGQAKYVDAATRAGRYMISAQALDGSFHRGRSAMARADCTTYYARAAWGLCELGVYTNELQFTAAGIRNIEYALSQQTPNGWFHLNCLNDPQRPLLHTIAYTIEGILGAGLLLRRDDFVMAAQRSCLALAQKQRADGGLSGRFAQDWAPQVTWDCLTGDAQMAICWWRLGEVTDNAELRDRARRICQFVMRTQNRTSSNPGIAGGIKGSFPVDGEYGRFQVLNWATKFFIDALLLTSPRRNGALTSSN